MLKKIKCVLFFIGDEDYQLIYYSNIIQSSAILSEIVNHIPSLFLLLVFILVSFIICYDFKFMCKFKLLWLFVGLTNFNPYHLLNFFQQNLIILKYGSVYEISRIFINYYVRRSYDLVLQGKLCIKNVFQLLACNYQL